LTGYGIKSTPTEQNRRPRFVNFSRGFDMKLIEKIAEDRPLRYAFAAMAILFLFGMVMN